MTHERARTRGMRALALVGALGLVGGLGIELVRGPHALELAVAIAGVLPWYVAGLCVWWRARQHPVAIQALATSAAFAATYASYSLFAIGADDVPVDAELPAWLIIVAVVSNVLLFTVAVLAIRLIALLPDGRYRFGYERVLLRAFWLLPLLYPLALAAGYPVERDPFPFTLLLWVLVSAPALLAIRFFLLPAAQRRVVRWLLGMALVAATPLLMAGLGLACHWSGWIIVGLLSIVVVPAALLVAALRHRLFGVDLGPTWTPRDGTLWLVVGLCLAGIMLFWSVAARTFLPIGLAVLLLIAAYTIRLSVELSKRMDQIRRQSHELAASRARIVHAQITERHRIQHRLHDGIQQGLVALVARIRLARNTLHRNIDRADAMLTEVQDDTYRVIDDLRELAHRIHPAELSDQGLVAAVESCARRAPIPVAVLSDEPLHTVRFATDIEESAYFLVAEALTNILKHAHATRATIRIARATDSLTVEVADDGIGLPASADSGSGLIGLRDRIEATGGQLDITSTPGKGTTVRAHLPAQEATHA